MRLAESVVIILGFLSQALASTRITLDEEAQNLCKKYKHMCKSGKICAAQHFSWPNNITIPVCIPLSFVPAEYKHEVRNQICRQPAYHGSCSARYIRWYFNATLQECIHFRYGGCEGNENNFMEKADCEDTCMSTPTFRLFEGGQHSALVQMKPSVMQPPVFESPALTNYEAMNGGYNLMRHRDYRIRNDETNRRMRRRLDKEKEKERKRKERKKEKRLRRLKRKKNKKNKKGKNNKKKNRKNKKKANKDDNKDDETDVKDDEISETGEGEVANDDQVNVIADEASPSAIKVQEIKLTEKELKRIERRRERQKRKRRQRNKRRSGKTRNKRKLNKRYRELVRQPDTYKMFSISDQGSDFADQKDNMPESFT